MPESPRFAFGKNWASFLSSVDEAALEQSVASMTSLLQRDTLEGQRLLDIGSGSGLFSLAAFQLGAEVTSIDVDDDSTRCTDSLRQRAMEFAQTQDQLDADAIRRRWKVQTASVLDTATMESLGQFDIVYSWGVLHHTGDMNRAIEIASDRVASGGQFAIAIYNDQGGGSRRWLAIKRGYHQLPAPLRPAYVVAIASIYELKFAAARLASCRNPLPLTDWRAKKRDRGMSVWHDWVDWVGGLPFEVAKPEAIIVPLIDSGFQLENLTTVGSGWGCNQYVFRRSST